MCVNDALSSFVIARRIAMSHRLTTNFPELTLMISFLVRQIEHGWRTAKRPGVNYFLAYLSQFYEIVLFTTQPAYVRFHSLRIAARR